MNSEIDSMRPFQLGWFSTGNNKTDRDLFRIVVSTIQTGAINAEFSFVFCNREPGESEQTNLFLNMVNRYQIPFVTVSSQKYRNQAANSPEWQTDYNRHVIQALSNFHPDLVVLAGYEHGIDQELCQKHTMIRLFFGLPGGYAGTWQETIWKLIQGNADETGLMMQLVTPEPEQSTVVSYCTFPIKGDPFDEHWKQIEGKSVADIIQQEGENNPLFRMIQRQVLMRESPLIVSTIRAFTEQRIRIAGNTVVDMYGTEITGYDLSEEVNSHL